MTINVPIDILHCTIGIKDKDNKEDEYGDFLLF
jgi:hypothetical protein